MRSPAWNALRSRLIAATVAVAPRGALGALLGVLALEFLVSNFLAIVALHRSRSILEGTGHARFPPSVKEPVSQEPPCVSAFSQIHDHGPICLCAVLSTKPCNLSHSNFILLAEGCHGFGSDLVFLI
jgi:hypothetical protein